MAAAFLSQSWYRVARLRPALGTHVRVHRHRYRDGAWYVLEDGVTGKVHRLSPAAYAVAGRLDGTRTLDEIWLEVAGLLGDAALTQDEVIGILAQLHAADLFSADVVPDIAVLDERRSRQGRALTLQNLLNPSSFRIPLLDPDRALAALASVFGWLVGPVGLVLWLALVVPAIVLAAQNWRALTENMSDRLLSTGSLLAMLLVYPAVKVLHEIGHGLVARRYGAPVHECGFLMLLFLPMPYMDVSASAAFPSRWRRAAVSAAGIMVETALAAGALYAWLAMEPGLARAIAFDVALVGGVSTVVANGNPLLRFDGYYVLSDVLNVPNLGSRANRYVQTVVDLLALGVEAARPFVATAGEKALFVLYAPAAFVYRALLTLSIAAFVAQAYFVLGVALAIWMAVQTFVMPLAKAVRALLTSPRYRRHRVRAIAVPFGGVAVALAMMFAIPAPSWSNAAGVVWLPETAQVRAGAPGFLAEYPAAPDGIVAPGDRLVVLQDPVIDARIAALTWRVRELSLKLVAHIVNDRVLAELTRIELDEARKQLDREEDRRAHMVARSAVPGRFVTARPARDGIGRFFKEGELIGYVLPERASEVRVVVTQDAIDRVRGSDRGIALMGADGPGPAATSALVRAVPAGLFELPSPALGLAGGGTIPTDPRDGEGRKALARVFQFDVSLPSDTRPTAFGNRVAVKFHHAPEPVGIQAYRRLRQLFLASFGA